MGKYSGEPLISIVMPAYNEEKYLSEAIYSIQNQTYQNWELVIVDDASTDMTWKIIEDFGKKESRIRSFRATKNQGACAALNEALKMAEGCYICWLSADDKYEPEMLQSSLQFLEQNKNFGAVFSRHKFIDENSMDVSLWLPPEKYKEIGSPGSLEPYYTMVYMGNAFNACTVLATAEAIRKAGYFNPDHNYAGDYDYMLRLAASVDIGFINQINVLSRIHPGQVTNQKKNDMDAIHVYEEMIFDENIRKKLFAKAGVPNNRNGLLITSEIRLIMYKESAMEPEERELENVRSRILQNHPLFVQADNYCNKVCKLMDEQKWDDAQEMVFKIPEEIVNFVDQEKWGIIAAAIIGHNGDYINEQDILESVLEINKANYEAHYMKGCLYENSDDYINALKSYALSVKYSQQQSDDNKLLLGNLERFIYEKL